MSCAFRQTFCQSLPEGKEILLRRTMGVGVGTFLSGYFFMDGQNDERRDRRTPPVGRLLQLVGGFGLKWQFKEL